MKTRMNLVLVLALALMLFGVMVTMTSAASVTPVRPQGPCDVYAAAGDPCVAAHSSTRALYRRLPWPALPGPAPVGQHDPGHRPSSSPPLRMRAGTPTRPRRTPFCANTYCWIAKLLRDQSGHGNDLAQAPHGGTGSPTSMGGFDSVPVADWAPITIMGHKAYAVFIEPGMGLRDDKPDRHRS